MTNITTVTPLSSIKSFQNCYHVRVRICRIWRPRKYDSEEYDGLHCVLVNEHATAIHAFIGQEQVENMSEKLLLGQLYDIYRFGSRDYLLNQPVVNHKVQIQFHGRTVFIKLPESVANIPQHSFPLIEFEQLPAFRDTQSYLADVYGCIKSIRPPHLQYSKKKQNWETKCDITVEDQRRGTLKIALWGAFAKTFDVQAVLKHGYGNHVLKDSPRLVYRKHGYGNHTRLTKTAFCKGVIAGFGKNGWWYRCYPVNNCYKQCFKNELNNKYECNNKDHKVQTTIPRFRVNTIIEDEVSDKTICFMGKPAEQFFGSNLQTLMAKHHYPTEETLPKEIIATIGQEHIFELRGNKYGDWNVVSTQGKVMSPVALVSEAEPATKAVSITSVPEPASETPEKTASLKKRGNKRVQRELFPTAYEKKTKRNAAKPTFSSSNTEQKDKTN